MSSIRSKTRGIAALAALTLGLSLGLAGCLGFGSDGDAPPQTAAQPASSLQTSAGGRAKAKTSEAGASGIDRPGSTTSKAQPAPAPPPPVRGAVVFPKASEQQVQQQQQQAAGLPTLPGATPPTAPLPGANQTASAAPGGALGGAAAPSAGTRASAPPPAPIPANIDPNAPGVPMLEVFRKEKFAALLTRADDLYAERSAQLALEYTQDGSQRPWSNPDTGTSGTIAPTKTYEKGGTWCREFAHTIQVRTKGDKDPKGAAEARRAFACRDPGGKWKYLPG